MVEPNVTILSLLREMRTSINARFEALGEEESTHHKQIIARLDELDEQERSFRQAFTDERLPRLFTGNLQERVKALRELETEE